MRIAVLGGIALTLLGVLLVRLWFLQIIGGDQYAAAAEGNRLRTVIIEAPRGQIVDRTGQILVTNRAGVNVVAQPRDLPAPRRRQVLARLAPKLGVPLKDLMKKMAAGDNRPFEPVVLAPNIRRPLAYYLAQRRRQFPGIGLQKSYLRTYPEGTLAAQLLGQTGKITAEQLAAYRRLGYVGNETVGQTGIERQYEDFLRGTPGEYVVEVDASGEPRGRGVVSSRAPQPGRTLQLSIDDRIQRALQNAVRDEVVGNGNATGGAGVALNPRTGEVLGLVSYPDFNPSVFVDGRPSQVRRVLTDTANPLLNRVIGGRYPAGSTFKAVTAMAGLEGGFITAGQLVNSPATMDFYGTTFQNFRKESHGLVNMPTALEVSSDTYFYQLGDKFYRATGSPLQAEADKFGFGRPSGIDLPGELSGIVPTPAWKQKQFAGPRFHELDRTWKPGDTINLSVGQGYLNITPLQLANAYATIANGGTLHTPRIGLRVLDPNGRVVRELAKGAPSRNLHLDQSALAVVKEGLFRVANGTGGTATAVFGGLPRADRVAGKTGTAQQSSGSDLSWFVGYAPFNDPKVVVAVVIDGGGTGASSAAPAVCKTIAAGLHFDPKRCGQGAKVN